MNDLFCVALLGSAFLWSAASVRALARAHMRGEQARARRPLPADLLAACGNPVERLAPWRT